METLNKQRLGSKSALGVPVLLNRDLLSTEDLSTNEIEQIYDTAEKMKAMRKTGILSGIFRNKTLAMIFHSPSMRTRMSFEATLNECGGRTVYFTPNMGRLKKEYLHEEMQGVGESTKDFARVLSLYASFIGIRIMEAEINEYGQGHSYLQEMAKYSSVPIINMADDKYHPCQGLAEFMALREHFNVSNKYPTNSLKRKRYLLSWSKGKMARGWNSVQESLLLAARNGMDIRIARPDGYDLDSDVYNLVNKYTSNHGAKFEITDSLNDVYEDVDVVCSRNWYSEKAYGSTGLNKEQEVEKASSYQQWFLSEERFNRTRNGVFVHPMPIERGMEVEDPIVDGDRSLVYKIAENKLHIQKAILYHLIGA